MSLEQPPPGHRASDQDRDRAAGLVQDAHSDGRLDVEELDERLTRVYSARTAVELRAVTTVPRPRAPHQQPACSTLGCRPD